MTGATGSAWPPFKVVPFRPTRRPLRPSPATKRSPLISRRVPQLAKSIGARVLSGKLTDAIHEEGRFREPQRLDSAQGSLGLAECGGLEQGPLSKREVVAETALKSIVAQGPDSQAGVHAQIALSGGEWALSGKSTVLLNGLGVIAELA